MISKYQVYHLYKKLSELGKAKKVTNKIYSEMLTTPLEKILKENFYMTPNIDYSANKFIDITNNINSEIITINDFAISILHEYLINKKFPTLSLCSNVSHIKQFLLFTNRKEIIDQVSFLNKLLAEKNNNLFQFSDKYTLFEVNNEQKNEIYNLINNKKVNLEFYIRGLESNKFTVDENKIQDKEYLKFVKISKIIINLKKKR